MKKALKIIGLTLLAILLLLVVAFLLLRFVFLDEARSYCYGRLRTERIELLRAAAPREADTVRFRFLYRQDTARAREIRTYFRLDTLLRPSAATWDNALALARFVARSIPHANEQIQPDKRNAIGLWEYSRTVEPAFNCRLHAILLHELLLASGIVNRFVTCLPADPEDPDCHVVNLVWLPERHKWAMLDSDMRAWLAGADGTPLSLEEMRERCIAGAPAEVRPLLPGERNDDYYQAYWAKNLYWFECWEETGYDRETDCAGRCIELLPPGFAGFRLDASSVRTTDAERFWAAPDTESFR